jgi:membrane protease YdiL (CAAX protease family)
MKHKRKAAVKSAASAPDVRAKTSSPNALSARIDRWFGPVPSFPMPAGLTPDRRAAVVLWSSAFLVVVLLFQGGFDTPGDLYEGWRGITEFSLADRMYWVGWGVFCYLLVPVAIILLVMRESPARYGLRFYISPRTLAVYAVLLVIMILPLLWASRQQSFVNRYPMVTDLGNDWGRILTWEAARALRFMSLEFFFRGYLLFGTEKRFGYHAIAISAMPYGIIHFAKPFPEALGAIVAGAVLGWLALRTRSIAGGTILHASVAISMDMLALYRKGAF